MYSKLHSGRKNTIIGRVAICVAAAFLFTVVAGAFLPADEREVFDKVVRLHILANSDSADDQALKLTVRDAVLDGSRTLFGNYENVADIISDSENITDKLTEIAENAANGEKVRVELGRESYPTCEYDGISFPSGSYWSLRVILGSGNGHNWWCVLFPLLCTSASTAKTALSGSGMSDDGIKVLTDSNNKKYVFRFYLLELLGIK